MPRAKKHQLRKVVPFLIRELRKPGNPGLEALIRGIEFANLESFCRWLATGVDRMANPENGSHGGAVHVYSTALLNKLRAKYHDHPEYFVSGTSTETGQSILEAMAAEGGFSLDDADSVEDSINL